MLKDESCWFLTVDFDKKSWRDDEAAFRETCYDLNMPVALERSRSGHGAHVWFFFDVPLPAVIARRMGCFLITETMARHHQLSMSSYDLWGANSWSSHKFERSPSRVICADLVTMIQ